MSAVATGLPLISESKDVEHEQHFLFSCPAYSDLRQYANLFLQAFSASDFFPIVNQMHVVVFSECFSRRIFIIST